MQSYMGDTIFEPEQTYVQVIDLWAKCLLANKRLQINEAGYNDIRVLKDGRTLQGWLNDDTVSNDDYNAFERELNEMQEAAEAFATLWNNQAKEREAAEKVAQQLQVEKDMLKQKKATYEALKKEFEQ